MGDGGDENDSEASLEGVDAASGPVVRAVVKVMEELLRLNHVFRMLEVLLWLQWLSPLSSLLFSLGSSTGPGPGLF